MNDYLKSQINLHCQMINFTQIPPEFTNTILTDYQKSNIEIKYHICYELKSNKGKQIELIRKLSDEFNITEEGIHQIIYRMRKNGITI